MSEKKKKLPVIALRGMTVMPRMVIHFDISRTKSIKAAEYAMDTEQMIFLTAQKSTQTEDPGLDDIYEVGVIASVNQLAKLPKHILRVLVSGEQRARIVKMNQTEPFMEAEVEILEDTGLDEENELSREAMLRGLKDVYLEYCLKMPKMGRESAMQIMETDDLKKLVDEIAANVPLHYKELQEILEKDSLIERYEFLLYKLVNEIQIMRLKADIQEKVKERVDKNQREYILREQLKLIREELGEDNAFSDADEFEEQAKNLKAPEEVKNKLLKEISRFRNTMNNPSENGVSRTYIETMLEMPWDRTVPDEHDLAHAKEVLEEDHYGLTKVKERVLEFMAVRALAPKGNSPILCLVGPPGTGKTSIAKSLARAMGKPYVRISLGGVRDEAEIRGHRKTYVGSMPGRIANAMKSAGVKNPLILLDEIDKVSTDYKGDTFSALLEVLDGEQNTKFRDHYLEVPLDLSEVTFVTTANTLQTIPRPLLDRMEVIEITSYTENEKNAHCHRTSCAETDSAAWDEKGAAFNKQKSTLEDCAELYKRSRRTPDGEKD